ncbi:hypothetical protein GGI35DRAFT_476195 [Trichoderma velutinum]
MPLPPAPPSLLPRPPGPRAPTSSVASARKARHNIRRRKQIRRAREEEAQAQAKARARAQAQAQAEAAAAAAAAAAGQEEEEEDDDDEGTGLEVAEALWPPSTKNWKKRTQDTFKAIRRTPIHDNYANFINDSSAFYHQIRYNGHQTIRIHCPCRPSYAKARDSHRKPIEEPNDSLISKDVECPIKNPEPQNEYGNHQQDIDIDMGDDVEVLSEELYLEGSEEEMETEEVDVEDNTVRQERIRRRQKILQQMNLPDNIFERVFVDWLDIFLVASEASMKMQLEIREHYPTWTTAGFVFSFTHVMESKIGHAPNVSTSDMIQIREASSNPKWDDIFSSSKRPAIEVATRA